MNLKQSMQQLERVIEVLTREKRSIQDRLASLDTMINNKLGYIAKIEQYRRDYDHSNGLRLSHTVPSLMINFNNFVKKIDISIENEKMAVQKVKDQRAFVETKFIAVEQKIKAVEVLLESKARAIKIKDENSSAEIEEALSMQQQVRSHHE